MGYARVVRVSYSLYLVRFDHGDASSMDTEVFQQLISPHIAERKPEYSFIKIHADDGGTAELYTTEANHEFGSVAVTRFSPGAVLELVARLAARLGASIVLQEGVALVADTSWLDQLPADIRPEAQVIDFTGTAIEDAISRL